MSGLFLNNLFNARNLIDDLIYDLFYLHKDELARLCNFDSSSKDNSEGRRNHLWLDNLEFGIKFQYFIISKGILQKYLKGSDVELISQADAIHNDFVLALIIKLADFSCEIAQIATSDQSSSVKWDGLLYLLYRAVESIQEEMKLLQKSDNIVLEDEHSYCKTMKHVITNLLLIFFISIYRNSIIDESEKKGFEEHKDWNMQCFKLFLEWDTSLPKNKTDEFFNTVKCYLYKSRQFMHNDDVIHYYMQDIEHSNYSLEDQSYVRCVANIFISPKFHLDRVLKFDFDVSFKRLMGVIDKFGKEIDAFGKKEAQRSQLSPDIVDLAMMHARYIFASDRIESSLMVFPIGCIS